MAERSIDRMGDKSLNKQDPLVLLKILTENKDNTPVLYKVLDGLLTRTKTKQDIKTLQKYIERMENINKLASLVINNERLRREFLRIEIEDELKMMELELKRKELTGHIVEAELKTHDLLFPQDAEKGNEETKEKEHQDAMDEVERLGKINRLEMLEKYKNMKLFHKIERKIIQQYINNPAEAEEKIKQLRQLFMEKSMF